ncbi:protein kinase [Nonomuraea spiralis]|uniref:serine/threonine-protein kinase n=1 Tax=Nonomuraea TaxID=83681 RepID=UPI000F76B5F8|nr:serine/threonine-protein kinase [Nonomuraea sp. WAC 01424]RSN09521.1 serine/threonine protein kinase [Nonomuraea sp. WAC 01424]
MLGAGTTLNDRYVLADRLGGGGMGEVWRADDLVLGRAVAVKVMMPALSENPTFTQRFQNEARAMATLRHRGVVGVYDYGVHEADGRRVSYLVMEYVRGESLDRVLRRGPLDAQEAMRLVAEVADALAAAHAQGIVHRDVKPANLMVRPDGQVALTDFGVAHSGSAGHLTATGTMLGSAAYCAPEMAAGSEVTPAVDVYALGVVAYECLTGRLPYQGDTPVQIIFKHLNAPVPELPGELPQAVRQVVVRALQKDPAQRWPSASDMARAARASISGAALPASPVTTSSMAAPPVPAPMMTGPLATGVMPAGDTGSPLTVPSAPTGGSRRRRTLTALITMAGAVVVSAAVAGSVWLRPAEPASTGGEVLTPAGETTPARSPSGTTHTTRQPAPPTKAAPSTRPSGTTSATPGPTVAPTTPSATPTTSPKPTPTATTAEPEPSQEPSQPGPEEPTAEPTVTSPPEDIQCVRAPCP